MTGTIEAMGSGWPEGVSQAGLDPAPAADGAFTSLRALHVVNQQGTGAVPNVQADLAFGELRSVGPYQVQHFASATYMTRCPDMADAADSDQSTFAIARETEP